SSTHRFDRGLIGGVLVAPADLGGGGDSGGLGDAHGLQRKGAIQRFGGGRGADQGHEISGISDLGQPPCLPALMQLISFISAAPPPCRPLMRPPWESCRAAREFCPSRQSPSRRAPPRFDACHG